MTYAFERLLTLALAAFGRRFTVLGPNESALIVGHEDGEIAIRVRHSPMDDEHTQRCAHIVTMSYMLWTADEMADPAIEVCNLYTDVLDAQHGGAITGSE